LGRFVVEKLKEKGIYENTLIIFTSDNGPHQEGGGDPNFFNSNGIYRGYKRDLYEGGIRVPTIISWVGNVPYGEEDNTPFAFWDYMPTFADLLDSANPKKRDGISMLPAIMNEEGQRKHEYFYFEFQEMGGSQAVIKGDWKLLHLNIRNKGTFELYNIASDPGENNDIISVYPKKAEELRKIMECAHTEDPNWPLF